jgi:hypothetical protein
MGLIYAGVPTKLVQKLSQAFNIPYFVETGTYLGDTTLWASQYFEHVITIEKSNHYWRLAQEKYSSKKNVQFLLGDSREVLKGLIPQINRSAIFWLDAHWSGGQTYGQNDECALLGELERINESPEENIILIDDARLFLAPPYRPYSPNYWPDISTVINIFNSYNYERYIVIIEDVIVAVPKFAEELVIQYCQDVNTQLWEGQQKYQNRFTSNFHRNLKQRFAALTRRIYKG